MKLGRRRRTLLKKGKEKEDHLSPSCFHPHHLLFCILVPKKKWDAL